MAMKVKTDESPVQYNPSGRSFSGWLGGKYQLARTIIEMMPQHKYYVEVFGGAGWVLFKKSPSQTECINDINGDLINLYRVLKYHKDAFLKEFEYQLISRDEFNRAKAENPNSLTDIQRACRFYFILRTCYGCRIDNPTFSQRITRSSSLKLGDELDEIITSVHQRLQRVMIENQSYDNLIRQQDHVDTLFYIDPPYYNCENYYGKDIFGRDDFENLKNILLNIKGKFILSLNDVPEVRELFKDFNIHSKKIRWSVNSNTSNNELGKEVIITNF